MGTSHSPVPTHQGRGLVLPARLQVTGSSDAGGGGGLSGVRSDEDREVGRLLQLPDRWRSWRGTRAAYRLDFLTSPGDTALLTRRMVFRVVDCWDGAPYGLC